MKRQTVTLPSILLLSLFLQGCVPKLPFNERPQQLSMPKKFPFLGGKSKMAGSSKSISTAEKSWQDFFVDKPLKQLIQTALNNNQELKILQQEVQIAHNEIIARKGEYLPKVWGGYGYEIEKVGDFTSQGASDATTQYEPGRFVPKVLHNNQIGLFASWEIDIWKKLRNATKSSYYRYLASIEVQKFMVTNLVAEIANTYYELKALDAQLAIVQQFIRTLKHAKEVVEIQKSAARSTSLAVKRFEAEVLKNQGRIYKLKEAIVHHENKLNWLVGRFPQPIRRSTLSLTNLIPASFKTGVPFELLENRPDIKQRCLQLEAANLDVNVARARFFPTIGIDAQVGYEAFKTNLFLISPESLFYTVAANLTAPIINRNAIKAAYFSASNKQIQAIYQYDMDLLKAYKEVSDNLISIKNLNKVYHLRNRQVRAMEDSVKISNMLFQAARVDYLEALLTQRDLLEAQMELVDIKVERLTAYVKLYKALGGGWRKTSDG